MATSQINGDPSTNNSTKNNGGSIIRSGNQSSLSNVPISNPIKPDGSFASIANDTSKIFSDAPYPNLKTQPIIFNFTQEILGGTSVYLSSPQPWYYLFSPPNKLIDLSNNNMLIKNNQKFMIITLVDGKQILVNPEDTEYFLSTINQKTFEKVCEETRIQNDFPIYADPNGNETEQVPHQWSGVRREKYSWLPNPCDWIYWGRGPRQDLVKSDDDIESATAIDKWLDVDPIINCYIYYTHKRTNIFLPGFGWRGTPGWGGHLCDKSEFDIYLTIWHKFFKVGVNFSNVDPINDPNTKAHIQNATPHDRFFHIPIQIDDDYKKAFLSNKIACLGSDVTQVPGNFQMFSTSGINHAPNLVVYLTMGLETRQKYILHAGNSCFIPTCEPAPNTSKNFIALSSSNMIEFNRTLAEPTPSDNLFTIIGIFSGNSQCSYLDNEADASCTPVEPQCKGWTAICWTYIDFDEDLLPSKLWEKGFFAEGFVAVGKLNAPNDPLNPKVIQFIEEYEYVCNAINGSSMDPPFFGILGPMTLCCQDFPDNTEDSD